MDMMVTDRGIKALLSQRIVLIALELSAITPLPDPQLRVWCNGP